MPIPPVVPKPQIDEARRQRRKQRMAKRKMDTSPNARLSSFDELAKTYGKALRLAPLKELYDELQVLQSKK